MDMGGIVDTMRDADFVVVDGVVFATEYLRVPDEDTVADDIVVEAKHGDTEIEFSLAELDDAQALGEGVFRLKDGTLIRFLAAETVH